MKSELVEWAAGELGAEVAAVRAVLAVESGGKASLPSGRAVVRYEGATFSKRTDRKFDVSHPHLSMRSWRDNSKHVLGGEAEWGRIEEAATLDRDEAYNSASYGSAQIMGFNFQTAGYPDVHAFVDDMNKGEEGQIRAFVNFLKGSRLDAPLRAKDWRAFARGYNGPGQVDHYSGALEDAYARNVDISEAEPGDRTLRAGAKGPDVRVLQQIIADQGFDPGPVDGHFGGRTLDAVKDFQTARGLGADGVVGPKTWAALRAGT
ncbi:MAG: N-acetylmuramidase domain-containing protein [Pseudomonadota bacterium]